MTFRSLIHLDYRLFLLECMNSSDDKFNYLQHMGLKQKWQVSFCRSLKVFTCSSFPALWKKMFFCFFSGFMALFCLFLRPSHIPPLPYLAYDWEAYSFLLFLACHCTHMLMKVLQILLVTKCIIYYLQPPQHNGMCLSSHNKCWEVILCYC